jgi:hypothetical protein
VVVAEQHLGDLERVGQISLPDEVGGGDDGGAPFPHVFRARQLVEGVTRLVEEVAADHVRGAEVHQVPVVNAVRAPQVQLEQLLPAGLGVFFLRPCLSMMLKAPALTSWTGLLSSSSISSGGMSMNSLASAKTWPIRTPINSSPSPYSPRPVLNWR